MTLLAVTKLATLETFGSGILIVSSQIQSLLRCSKLLYYMYIYYMFSKLIGVFFVQFQIAGNANEEQILVAALAFLERTDMLQKVLNELFHLLRFESCVYVGQALNIVLEAMNRNLTERHVQISGSATLFYIVKGTGKQLHDVVRVKRRVITALLNGMSVHRFDETMMRNGCLTLCQFKIPTDVVSYLYM